MKDKINFLSHGSSLNPVIQKQEFSSLEELLEHPWIKSWNEGQNEFQYCWTPYEIRDFKSMLMISYKTENHDKKWFVLGYMDIIPDLPQMDYR